MNVGKVLLFGEPMALLVADTSGPLEEVEHFTRFLSGAEVNVAIGLTRLGHEVEYFTKLGDDPFGHYIEKNLRNNGIGTSQIVFDPVYRTGIQLKNRVLDGSDPYAPYYRKGSAASHITKDDIKKLCLDDVDLIHITGIPPALSETVREATFFLMEEAAKRNITITFDPNLRPALWESRNVMVRIINELAAGAQIIMPGIEECRILTDLENEKNIAEFYQNMGVKMVIIKNGKNPTFVKDGNDTYEIPCCQVEKVEDTVGAGDGFAVGVLSGYLEKKSVKQMIQRGNAIGAIQVMNISDNDALPTREQLAAFMEKAYGESPAV